MLCYARIILFQGDQYHSPRRNPAELYIRARASRHRGARRSAAPRGSEERRQAPGSSGAATHVARRAGFQHALRAHILIGLQLYAISSRLMNPFLKFPAYLFYCTTNVTRSATRLLYPVCGRRGRLRQRGGSIAYIDKHKAHGTFTQAIFHTNTS